MSVASSRRFDRAVPLVAGVMVVAFAAGSSSVRSAKDLGIDSRWALLAALAVVAAACGRKVRPQRELVLAVVASAAFVAVALVSAGWSVDASSTLARGASLGVLLGTAALLALGTRGRRPRVEALLDGLLGGAVTVAVAGLIVLALDRGIAVESASYQAPWRFRGFGEDPNTVPLLLAVVTPIALRLLIVSTARRRAVGGAVMVLFAATIATSGSRGALLAATAGAAVLLLLVVRGAAHRAVAFVALAAAVGVCALVQSLPKPEPLAPAPAAPAASAVPEQPRYRDAEAAYALDADVGRPLPGGGEPVVSRSYLGASGRTDAWRGALDVAAERPLVGYGFGTEGRVFVDRYYRFVGGLPENSYLGIALQLGIVGLALLLGLVGLLVWRARSAVLGDTVAAACAAVVAAGLAAALVQSYVYSVGNVATASFWISAFMLPALASAEVDA